jgi:TonB family protein
MSAATALALEKPRRVFQRHPINIPLDMIALRSGVPENLPGRCTDISEAGVGAAVAGELSCGQQVAIELRLPGVGVPIRARALVSYQAKFHCGFEFVGLSIEQREMIRYWAYNSVLPVGVIRLKTEKRVEAAKAEVPILAAEALTPVRKIRIVRKALYLLVICILVLAGVGWWQWQKSWGELEKQSRVGQLGLRVAPGTMEQRILTKVEPLYPDAARSAGTEGLVVLDAVIGPDGDVKRLSPLSGSDLLVQSATDAVQLWKFEPYYSSGKPVEVETTLAVEFRLN